MSEVGIENGDFKLTSTNKKIKDKQTTIQKRKE